MKRNIIVRVVLSFGILGFSLLQWITSTACTSPLLIHDIQTAEPLGKVKSEKQWDVNVSGGIGWGVTGLMTLGLPTVPNAEFNMLIRYASKLNSEVQFPINLSSVILPIEGIAMFHLGSGAFVKNSELIQSRNDSVDKFDNEYYHRSLYSSNVYGLTFGSINTVFADSDGWDYDGLPFMGFQFKRIIEMPRSHSIGIKGFTISGKIYGDLFGMKSGFDDGVAFPLKAPTEFFVNGFIGREYRKYIFQFTYGVGYQYILGPRIFLGTTFSSK